LIEPANMPEPHVTGTVRGTGPRAPAVFGGRAASPVVGLVAGGLGAYWPQFPELLPHLKSSAAFVSSRLQTLERLAAGMILGASLLTSARVPVCGEYELRTSLAMLIMDRLGAGGSFTEMQALNFRDGVVEMGHDGPAHLAISERRPLLRGLGVFHGKRGWGVSVEFDVKHAPVTVFGMSQLRDGRLRFIVSEGEVVAGPLLQIGSTTSRVDFGRDPGDWCDARSATAAAHHWALGTGHKGQDLGVLAELLGVELVTV
jgi:L-arabinose isomerase